MCNIKYDYKQLLIECGLSTKKAERLASALQAAIERQNTMHNCEGCKECGCNESGATNGLGATAAETVTTNDTMTKKKKRKTKKDVNEVFSSRNKE